MKMASVVAEVVDEVKGNTGIVTYTGRVFDPTKPENWSFDIRDIAQALATINRFGGHVYSYNVADHSVRVMQRAIEDDCAPITQLACLMHDAAEAYLGDVPSPIKKITSIAGTPFAAVEEDVHAELMMQLFGSSVAHAIWASHDLVKKYDWEQYVAERAARPFIPASLNPVQAYDAFMAQYRRLCGELEINQENVETPERKKRNVGATVASLGSTPENVDCQTCGGEGRLVNLGRFGDPYSGCPDCGYCE